MKKYLLCAIIMLAGCSSASITLMPEPESSIHKPSIVTIVTPPVIPIKCEMPIFALVCTEYANDGKKRISQGTGFLIKHGEKFYIITAGHVIYKSNIIKAEMRPGFYYSVYITPRIILPNDTAILDVVGFTKDSDYLELSIKDTFPGQQVISSGYPHDVGYREVSGVALEYDVYPLGRMLSSTCKIMPGMSGGPIMQDCLVVGVNVLSRLFTNTLSTRGALHSSVSPIIKALSKCQ